MTKAWADRIGRRLKLRDLHIFMVAAQCSMGRAATELAMSQPAVSRAISDLEHSIRVRLLDRSPQGIEPTLYGEALLRWAGVVFDDLRQSVKEIEFLADPSSGEVRIGTTEPMAAGFVPAVVERLSRQYPRLIVHVLQAATVPLQYRDLRDRRTDAVLGWMLPGTPDDDLASEVLFMDRHRVVASADNPWTRKRRISLSDLAGEPWTLPLQDGWIGPRVIAAFRASGLDLPASVAFSNSIQFHNAMMATGRFLTVVSESMVRFSGKRLELKILPVDLPMDAGPVGITTLKKRTLNPVIKLIADTARQIAGTTPGKQPTR
jgi:DNA-binding transcriptional LysR family regulator